MSPKKSTAAAKSRPAPKRRRRLALRSLGKSTREAINRARTEGMSLIVEEEGRTVAAIIPAAKAPPRRQADRERFFDLMEAAVMPNPLPEAEANRTIQEAILEVREPKTRAARQASNALHVVPRGGGWHVVRVGQGRAHSRHTTQRAAVQAAADLARRGGGEVVLHGRDGLVRARRTYPRPRG